MKRREFIGLASVAPLAVAFGWPRSVHLVARCLPIGARTTEALVRASPRFAGALLFDSDGPHAVTWGGAWLELEHGSEYVAPGRVELLSAPTIHDNAITGLVAETRSGDLLLCLCAPDRGKRAAFYIPAVGLKRLREWV